MTKLQQRLLAFDAALDRYRETSIPRIMAHEEPILTYIRTGNHVTLVYEASPTLTVEEATDLLDSFASRGKRLKVEGRPY